EISAVLTNNATPLDGLTIKASKNANEVTAAYEIEETTLEMIIHFPATYPLRQIEVESGNNRAGVSEARWRSWLLAATAIMVSQSESILDALRIFHKNISMHFEGFEDCAICYSIIGALDRALPTKECKTCKHKFHASCLYKWFRTSNQSSCPLCRSQF
ncbi:uncharacterized protein BJ171DRAFT_423168, partial [Polychytrium aggregatum]|uniref:uncharacterized protein n=1 Tax=Polychytrium aggregatum TaxID=110093 RepID=UPI0022FEC7FE